MMFRMKKRHRLFQLGKLKLHCLMPVKMRLLRFKHSLYSLPCHKPFLRMKLIESLYPWLKKSSRDL